MTIVIRLRELLTTMGDRFTDAEVCGVTTVCGSYADVVFTRGSCCQSCCKCYITSVGTLAILCISDEIGIME